MMFKPKYNTRTYLHRYDRDDYIWLKVEGGEGMRPKCLLQYVLHGTLLALLKMLWQVSTH